MSEPAGNVLLLTFARRGEEAALRRALIRLYARYPSARVIAIGTPATEPVLKDFGVEHVLVHGAGQPARRVIEEAQLCMPEAAAVVYDNPRFGGHLKLEALAFLVGPRTILRCPPEGEPVTVRRLRLAFTVAGKTLSLGLRLCLGAAVTLLAY